MRGDYIASFFLFFSRVHTFFQFCQPKITENSSIFGFQRHCEYTIYESIYSPNTV